MMTMSRRVYPGGRGSRRDKPGGSSVLLQIEPRLSLEYRHDLSDGDEPFVLESFVRRELTFVAFVGENGEPALRATVGAQAEQFSCGRVVQRPSDRLQQLVKRSDFRSVCHDTI